eukprot:UN04782
MSIQAISSWEEYQTAIRSPSVVIYSASWCQPCKMLKSKLPAVLQQYPKIKAYSIDCDDFEEQLDEAGETPASMPTSKVFVGGAAQKVIVGANVDKLRAAFDEVYEVEGWAKGEQVSAAPIQEAPKADGVAAPAPVIGTPVVANSNAGQVLELTSEKQFDDAIQQPNVVVAFKATWCQPCKQIAPYIKTLAQEYPQVAFYNIDFDEFDELADKYDVTSLPSFLFFKNGKKAHMFVGVNKEKFLAALKDKFQL